MSPSIRDAKRDRAIHVLVFDGFADWEPAHALAELARSGARTIRTVGFTLHPVRSMGGMRIVPDTAVGDVEAADVELLILPGGDSWELEAYPRGELERLLRALLAVGSPIAAICSATAALARIGALNQRRHTSTMRSDLSSIEGYAGHDLFVEELAVSDRQVITASGLGAVDFARSIFAELEIFGPQDEQLWFEMYKLGRAPAPSP